MCIVMCFTDVNVLPPEQYLNYELSRLSRMNRYANYAWIIGAAALLNIAFFLRFDNADRLPSGQFM